MHFQAPDPHWFRRLNHTAAAAIIVFFLIPKEPWGLLPRWLLLLMVLMLPLSVELVRLKRQSSFMGLREYEKGRLSSYMWFNLSAVMLLLWSDLGDLPQGIAAGCIVLAAMVDPLLGELKPKGRERAMVVGTLAAAVILALFDIQLYYALPAAALAVYAEQFQLRNLDDDMIMQVVPALFLALCWVIGDNSSLLPELSSISISPYGGGS